MDKKTLVIPNPRNPLYSSVGVNRFFTQRFRYKISVFQAYAFTRDFLLPILVFLLLASLS